MMKNSKHPRNSLRWVLSHDKILASSTTELALDHEPNLLEVVMDHKFCNTMAAVIVWLASVYPLTAQPLRGFVCDTEVQTIILADSFKESSEEVKKNFERLFEQKNKYGEQTCVFKELGNIMPFVKIVNAEVVDTGEYIRWIGFFNIKSEKREFWILISIFELKPKEEKIL